MWALRGSCQSLGQRIRGGEEGTGGESQRTPYSGWRPNPNSGPSCGFGRDTVVCQLARVTAFGSKSDCLYFSASYMKGCAKAPMVPVGGEAGDNVRGGPAVVSKLVDGREEVLGLVPCDDEIASNKCLSRHICLGGAPKVKYGWLARQRSTLTPNFRCGASTPATRRDSEGAASSR